WKAARLPLSSSLPSPRLRTLPCLGFSLAESGRTMPPAVFSSASRRFTTILSLSGTTFMPSILLAVNALFGSYLILWTLGAAVDAHQGTDHRIKHHMFADRLGDNAVSPSSKSLADQDLVRVGRDQDARQLRMNLVGQ